MNKTKIKLTKGLSRMIVATILVGLLFIASFLVFAFLAKDSFDTDLVDASAIANYFGHGVVKLVMFEYANLSVIVYFALSCFLYAIVICWVIFLIASFVVADKKRRKVVYWGAVLTFFNLVIYLVAAAGSQKFWHIINLQWPFEDDKVLALVVLIMILLGVVYVILSVSVYFWTIFESYKYPRKPMFKEAHEEFEYDDEEVLRRIVRDELLKLQPLKVVIVGNETLVQPEPVKEEKVVEPEPIVEEVKEEPVVEEEVKVEEPVKKEEKKIIFPKVDFWRVAATIWPQIKKAPALRVAPKEEPVVEEAKEEAEEDDDYTSATRKPREPFITRILKADIDIKANYNELKNEILSYGVKSRISRGGDVFRLHNKKYVKIFLVGKTLKVYLALNPEDYKDSTIPVEDVGHRPAYAEIPLLFKVKSPLSVRRCKSLIQTAMEKDNLEQSKVKNTNWVSELRKINSQKAKEKKNK